MGFQVRYGEMPLWPSEVGQYLRGHGETVRQQFRWPIPNRRAELKFVAFNEDEIFQHTLYVRVWTSWAYEQEPTGLMRRALNLLLAFFERVVGLTPGGE